mgnify:CR=1 FL=1
MICSLTDVESYFATTLDPGDAGGGQNDSRKALSSGVIAVIAGFSGTLGILSVIAVLIYVWRYVNGGLDTSGYRYFMLGNVP